MFTDNEDVAMIRVYPTVDVPVGLVLANFAEHVEYEQWIAVVLGDRVALIKRIEGPAS